MESLRFDQHGLDTWRITSERWSVDLLLNKGADLSSLRHTQMGELLLRTNKGLTLFEGRDLLQHPLTNYNELYFGGWQNLLPHRAMIDEQPIAVENQNASCVIWRPVVCTETADGVQATLTGEMPGFGFVFERTLLLNDREDRILIQDCVENHGTQTVFFAWTHHIAFGGDLCRPDVRLNLPACRWLDLRDWEQDKTAAWQKCLKPLSQATDDCHQPCDLTTFPETEQHIYGLLTDFAQPYIDFHRSGHVMRFSWGGECFPHLRYWAQKDADLHTIALEPSTSLFNTIQDTRAHDMGISLAPTQVVSATISFQYQAADTEEKRHHASCT